jgi:hypothetical protein
MNEKALSDLARSGISKEDAEEAGMFYVENAKEIFPEFKPLPALVIPYFHPIDTDEQGLLPMTFNRKGRVEQFARVRYLRLPPAPKGKKQQRYDQPAQSGVQAYFSPLLDWPGIFNNTAEAIFFTEGEKKAAAAAALSYPVIGLGGVYNFKDKSEGNEFLPILARIPWAGRHAYIVYDSDYADNPDVRIAADRLAAELSLKRGAIVKLVVIPPGPKGEDGKPTKQGLDDYLLAYGVEAFEKLIADAPDLRKVDAEVLALNADIAFIEHDGVIYDFRTRAYLDKATFLSGSDYSTRFVAQAGLQGNKVKNLQLAKEWLTHEKHRIYRDTAFDPSTSERTLERADGGKSLNLWEGLPESEPGDVQPFLDLTDYLFSLLPDEDKDLALNLVAWKVQNPEKLPRICITLLGVGKQGSGKSLWADIVRQVFGTYGVSIPSSALVSEFNPWMETSLCVVIDEAEPEHVSSKAGGSALKKYIADPQNQLRDLYRKGRQVTNRSMVILTSNHPEVGHHEEGDRRMFVVSSPPKHPEGPEFYNRIGRWIERGGIRWLRHFLQTYDLKGWVPPNFAPMTAEKRMAAAESRSPIQRIGMAMMEAKGDGFIVSTLDKMNVWAQNNETSPNQERAARAREIALSILNWPIRPYYTPEELTVMLPEIASMLGYVGKGFNGNIAGKISRDLRSVQIPYLLNKDHPEGFMYRGQRQQFLVVSHHDDYSQPMSQADFDRNMGTFTTFGQLRLKPGTPEARAASPLQVSHGVNKGKTS